MRRQRTALRIDFKKVASLMKCCVMIVYRYRVYRSRANDGYRVYRSRANDGYRVYRSRVNDGYRVY